MDSGRLSLKAEIIGIPPPLPFILNSQSQVLVSDIRGLMESEYFSMFANNSGELLNQHGKVNMS